MLYPIGAKIKESIAEVAEEELKECFPGKVDKVKVVENADGFFLKVVGSISSAELENFMLNFFSRKGKYMAEIKKKEESSLGLNDVVGGILGQAIQNQIADSLNAQMPAIIETAQKRIDTIVSDFSRESSEKLKSLDSVVDQRFSQYTTDIDGKINASEKTTNTIKEALKAVGKVLIG